ncbi:hypothetical protein GRI40_05345 [Altererythrobacter aerius]|uniref:Uncharacterized protein n=1 Tax=Tsuneonella aeria TaxID=1837929 RepID=A0A6I4TDC3_9SPHN|nr:hypothetical protein [Tsuneonella aeria]MXO74647.1 hypothetical protein [Tsuneonella aeria]
MTNDRPPRDPAKARFYFMAFHRVLGAVLVVLGLLVIEGQIDWPRSAGWAFLGLGLVDVFLAPFLLARLWRTPPQ